MKASSTNYKKEKGCNALCCGCRISVSSSSSSSSSSEGSHSSRYASISSLAHAMVQERLDQMIQERRESSCVEERRRRRNRNEASSRSSRSRSRSRSTKFVVMLAMEKCSYDPREDFRESMVEMIMENRIKETKDLRSLLNYYMSMNSEEYHRVILEVFHEVCANLFRRCRSH